MRAEESILATLAQGGRKEEPGRGPLPSCIQGGQGEGGHTCKVRAGGQGGGSIVGASREARFVTPSVTTRINKGIRRCANIGCLNKSLTSGYIRLLIKYR